MNRDEYLAKIRETDPSAYFTERDGFLILVTELAPPHMVTTLDLATMQFPSTEDRSWVHDVIPLQSEVAGRVVTNYQLQAQVADELNNALRERMLADGYVEIAPGSWMRP